MAGAGWATQGADVCIVDRLSYSDTDGNLGLHAIIGLSPAQSGLAARIGGGCIEASNCVAILPM